MDQKGDFSPVYSIFKTVGGSSHQISFTKSVFYLMQQAGHDLKYT